MERHARSRRIPVVFSILTNIVAFVPLMFIPGETGKFWGPLPVVVIIVLSLSLTRIAVSFCLHTSPTHEPVTIPQKANTNGASWRWRSCIVGNRQSVRTDSSTGSVEILSSVRSCSFSVYVFDTSPACVALGAMFLIVSGYATSAHMGMILMPEVSADEIECGCENARRNDSRIKPRRSPKRSPASEPRECSKNTTCTKSPKESKPTFVVESFIDVEIVMKPPDRTRHDRQRSDRSLA